MVRCTPNSGPSRLELPLSPATDTNRSVREGPNVTHNGSQRLSINALFQLLQQCLRDFQVGGVEAVVEPVVDGAEQVVRLVCFARALARALSGATGARRVWPFEPPDIGAAARC